MYVWVEANTVAASIESERAKGSQLLRMFRVPVRKARIVVPLQYGDLDVGDTFVVDNPQGPHPLGAGWGKKDWERREMVLLSSSLNPAKGVVELVALDARDFRCGLWSPLVTDLGFSEDGNGIPVLHHGNPITFDTAMSQRPSTHYVQKHTGDLTASACGTGKGLWTPYGLWAGFPITTNLMLNSTFKDTAGGSTFDNWTHSASGGGTRSEDTMNFLIDADGYRRGIKFTSPTSGTIYSYQTSATVGASGYLGRVRIHFNRLSAAPTAGDGERTTDGYAPPPGRHKYWNNTTQGWQADRPRTEPRRASTGLGGLQRYVSSRSPLVSSSTYTPLVGPSWTPTPGRQLRSTRRRLLLGGLSGSACGVAAQGEPILPTGNAMRASEPDHAYVKVSSTGNEIREDRGTMTLRWTPTFDHADMSDGDIKVIWTYRRNWGVEYMRAYYYRNSATEGHILFKRVSMVDTTPTSMGPTVVLTGSNRAARGQEMALGFRWTSASGELGLDPLTATLFVVPVPGGTVQSGSATWSAFTTRGITISDSGGGSLIDGYSNSWARGSAASGWGTAGFSTKTQNQRITAAGGGVSFMPYCDRTHRVSTVMLGLDPVDPDKSFNTIDFALYYHADGATMSRWEVYENGTSKATGSAYSWATDTVYGGYVGRVQVEAGPTVKYYVSGTNVYTSAVTEVPFPLYVDSAASDPTYSQAWGVAMYGNSVAGDFNQSACDPARLEFPMNPGLDPLGTSAQCGGGTYKHLEVTPYVLTDQEVTRRLR